MRAQLTPEQKVLVDRYRRLSSAVDFVEEMRAAGDMLCGMLGSSTASDVVEALRFFVKASAAHAFSPFRRRILPPCMWSGVVTS